MERSLSQISEQIQGEVMGDGRLNIRGVSGILTAKPGDITFVNSRKMLAPALESKASAVMIPQDLSDADLGGRPGIRVKNPKLAFALLLELFYPERWPEPGIHSSAVIGKNAKLGDKVSIAAHAVIGENVSIGAGSFIGAGVSIADDVVIGERSGIFPNVVIYRRTQIGDRVIIHGGCVIGGDGFGYVMGMQGAYVKVPQTGNVVIESDVEMGCNTCVDRATVGSTVVKQGSKFDNFVQVAHNDQIGKHVILAGQVGLAGSVTIGDYAVLGGKAGVIDHLNVGPGVQAGAATIITKDIPAKQIVWGYPARPLNEAKRAMAVGARLPEMTKTIARLAKQLEEAQARLEKLEQQARKK